MEPEAEPVALEWTESDIARLVKLRTQRKGPLHIALAIHRHVNDVIAKLADAGVRARVGAIRREREVARPKRVYRDKRRRTKVTKKDNGVTSAFGVVVKEKCASGDKRMAAACIWFEDDPRAVPSEGIGRFSRSLSDRSYVGNSAAMCMR